jgi:hypothetical protein
MRQSVAMLEATRLAGKGSPNLESSKEWAGWGKRLLFAEMDIRLQKPPSWLLVENGWRFTPVAQGYESDLWRWRPGRTDKLAAAQI